jgi:hypothetical protein
MKKILLFTLLILFTNISFGQWTYRTIDSVFDGKFKKAYTNTYNRGFLLMELGESTYKDSVEIKRPFLALSGLYFCDESTTIDFVLIVNGQNKKYELSAIKSNDSQIYYFDESIWTNDFTNDFKTASKCSIRVNQTHCSDEYYTFNFSGSKTAYNFITR